MDEIKTDTYIRLYRKFTKWEWYDDANTMRVFLHCLLNANYTDKKWRGILVKRGSFLTGRRKLAVSLNLTEMQIRTALNKLKSTNEITVKTTSEYSIITINNWDSHQTNNQPLNQRVTNEQPTNNQRITTTNKDNKDNKDNKEINKEKKKNFVAKSFFQKLIAEDEDLKKYSSLKDLFIEFLEYKTAIKKQYKTEKSVRNAFIDLIRLSGGDANYARALVDNTIARGWQGIYDLSAEQKKNFKNTQNQSDDWESRCM